MKGGLFVHSFWVKDLQSMEPVDCIVTDEDEKFISFKALDEADKRRTKIKRGDFRGVVKKWIG